MRSITCCKITGLITFSMTDALQDEKTQCWWKAFWKEAPWAKITFLAHSCLYKSLSSREMEKWRKKMDPSVRTEVAVMSERTKWACFSSQPDSSKYWARDVFWENKSTVFFFFTERLGWEGEKIRGYWSLYKWFQ